MNGDRIFKIVIMELTTDNLKLEDELESVINSKLEMQTKLNSIKTILTKMTSIEASIAKFTSMMSNNNKEEKQ